MIENNDFYSSYIDSHIDLLLKKDPSYDFNKTAFKSAQALRTEHIQAIKEKLQFKSIKQKLSCAISLILEELPRVTSPEKAASTMREMENSAQHFSKYLEHKHDEQDSCNPQHLFGYSNETMLIFCDLGASLLEKKYYAEAASVYLFLCFLAPDFEGFWVLLGRTLQLDSQFQEAAEAYEIALLVNANAIEPYIHLCLMALENKEMSKAQDLYEKIEHLAVSTSQEEDFLQWGPLIKKIDTLLKTKY